MPLANNAYTDPGLLLGAGITSTIADVWPHCLTLMKTIRLLRILCKEPPPRGGLCEDISQKRYCQRILLQERPVSTRMACLFQDQKDNTTQSLDRTQPGISLVSRQTCSCSRQC